MCKFFSHRFFGFTVFIDRLFFTTLKKPRSNALRVTLCVCLLAGWQPLGYAAELRIMLQDAETGLPLSDAVIEVLLPAALQATHTNAADYSVDQIGKEFVANVSVVPRGSRINFPNSDDILHHVYSFSPARAFDLPLYGSGQNINNYLPFEEVGIVELGCNIHDWMLAHVYVAETSLAVKTDAAGQAFINGIPAGSHVVKVWHSLAEEGQTGMEQQINFAENGEERLQMALSLRRDMRLRRAPTPARSRYR